MDAVQRKQMQKIISQIAAKNGVSVQYARQQMQAAIDAAYNSTDLTVHARFKTLFGNKKPSIEEFISKAAADIF